MKTTGEKTYFVHFLQNWDKSAIFFLFEKSLELILLYEKIMHCPPVTSRYLFDLQAKNMLMTHF